jgi:hypothetical protein
VAIAVAGKKVRLPSPGRRGRRRYDRRERQSRPGFVSDSAAVRPGVAFARRRIICGRRVAVSVSIAVDKGVDVLHGRVVLVT